MSHPLTRVLTLLELLQSHPRLTGRELADQLGTDVRTVRRYAAHLRDLGIPVAAERGRHGGYCLARGYRMPPLVLTNDEALAVVVGLLAAERLGMSMTTPAHSGALAKIERVLPRGLREPLAAIRETLSFTTNTVTAQAPETGVLLALAQASRARTVVRMSYRSWQQEQTERDLDPYGVVFHRGRWKCGRTRPPARQPKNLPDRPDRCACYWYTNLHDPGRLRPRHPPDIGACSCSVPLGR